jgi:hypothetical protein
MLVWIGLGVVVLAAAAAIAAGPIMSRVEQPKYDVVERTGAIEIRGYAPMIAAETSTQGERKQAIEQGFRRIAAYIFGANKPRAKIAMTAPVVQQPGSRIAMTAPVTQQIGGTGDWTVSFIMPAQWTMETLPQPDDASVRLVPIPARRMIAVTFSGVATNEAIDDHIRELRAYAGAKGLTITGEPVLAFYNPPWTVPPLRRNEVMFALADER